MKVFGPVTRLVGGAACALALTACGGGGGGDSAATASPATPAPTPVIPAPVTPPPVAKPDQSWLTIAPASVDITAYAGEATTVSITAESAKTFTKPFNVAIVDKSGVFSTDVKVTALSDVEYRADLKTSAALPVGQRSVELELRLCEDDPKICDVPMPGSPWLIPVKVKVLAQTNLTPLSVLPNVANWSTYQGNASHNPYVPATFDPSKFSRRWALPASSYGDLVTSPVHDNGRLFASLNDSRDGTADAMVSKAVLVAYSEDSGKELWRVDFGPSSHMNPPAAANGKVYVVAKDCCDTFFWAFDQATGKLLSKKNMSSPLWPNRAPTIFGDAVYANTNFSDGALTRFGATTFEQVWQSSVQEFKYWTPAVDGSHAYVYAGGSLHAVATSNGAASFSIANPYYNRNGETNPTVVLSGNGMAFVHDENGYRAAFDLTSRTIAWWTDPGATGLPVVGNGMVYSLGGAGHVLSVSPATLERSGAGWGYEFRSGEPYTNLVLTDNLIFASSDSKTVAIDLATITQVWELPVGGQLSISNRGVLYVSGKNGKITAINLR